MQKKILFAAMALMSYAAGAQAQQVLKVYDKQGNQTIIPITDIGRVEFNLPEGNTDDAASNPSLAGIKTITFSEDGQMTITRTDGTTENVDVASKGTYTITGTPTGIGTVAAAKQSIGKTYDLSGRIVGRGAKGIVITDGKKIIRK